MDAWAPGAHGNTFGGNPVACAAAAATLDVIEAEGLVGNAARRGTELITGLKQLTDECQGVLSDVRGRGLMIGLELASLEAATRLRQHLLERQVVVSTCGPHGSVVRLAPPSIIIGEQIERFLMACRGALAAIVATPL